MPSSNRSGGSKSGSGGSGSARGGGGGGGSGSGARQSDSAWVKSGWGSKNNFAASYGIKPDSDGYAEANQLVKAMRAAEDASSRKS